MRRLLPLVCLALLLVQACSHAPAPAGPSRPPVLVRMGKAERRDVPFEVRVPGLVLASESVAVVARMDSQVTEVRFREGDMVHQGQLLFVLDDRALAADLRRQQATLATAEADLHNARRQFERAQRLAAEGFESTAGLDKARADFEMAEARSAATAAEIDRLGVLLGYTRITAPIDGRMGVVQATVGNAVKANDAAKPMVLLNRISPVEVQMGLTQRALEPLRARMAEGVVEVRVVRDGLQIPDVGRVTFVDNNINRTTATFETRAVFANANEALWPGMIVEAVLTLGTDRNAVAVPDVAVQHGSSGDFVFTTVEGKAHRVPVVVSRYGEGVAVLGQGLEGGEDVVVDGVMALSEGTPVEVAGQKPAAEPAAAGKAPGAAAR